MGQNLHIEIADEAATMLFQLMVTFGDKKPSDALARVLGLADAVKPFIKNGILTVLDQDADQDDDERRFVDLVIERDVHEREAA